MTASLTLYVAGDGARSSRAASNLRRLCDLAGIDRSRLEIVDVHARPDLADEAGILATPTVVAVQSHSTRRVIGDLSDLARLASALDIELDLDDEGDAS